MTDLVLVRHGETIWHAENRYAGSSDVPLTPRGRLQAEELASWAATAHLAGVWTSTLNRARRTAAPCADAVEARLVVDARLRELDFGVGEGLTRAEMRQRFPEALDAFIADPAAHHLPDGEDPAAAARRFVDCLREIARRHADGRVLVVAHGTIIRLALCRLMGLPLGRYRQVFPIIDNCAVTEIRLDVDRFSLLAFNARLAQQPSPPGGT